MGPDAEKDKNAKNDHQSINKTREIGKHGPLDMPEMGSNV
jgi:hypothetical protein